MQSNEGETRRLDAELRQLFEASEDRTTALAARCLADRPAAGHWSLWVASALFVCLAIGSGLQRRVVAPGAARVARVESWSLTAERGVVVLVAPSGEVVEIYN